MYDTDGNASAARGLISGGAGFSREHTRNRARGKARARPRPGKNLLLADLIQVLSLERLERDLFRGESRDIGASQVFGGQVIAQALQAACLTVEERSVHSLHAYFLRRGDVNAPIVYQVERARDGTSFSSRRVSATQHGEEILNMGISFQSAEEGFEHQLDMPDVPAPESLASAHSLIEDSHAHLPEKLRKVVARAKPFEFRFVDPLHFMPGVGSRCAQHLWFRAIGGLPADTRLHSCLLAYVSDYYLLSTAVRPHGAYLDCATLLAISIDHSIWFHRPARLDEWLLYSIDSPSASGARGFTRASIFTREGELVASTAQEGLMRTRIPRPAPLGRNS